MTLRFRNLAVTPANRVELWGTEGHPAVIDRGTLRDWKRIAAATDADPYGRVAERLAALPDLAEDAGVVTVVRRRLASAQDRGPAGRRHSKS